ncbi:tol-pal system protein YbgF [Allopseudospirillum japonicum]|uniref:Cell division coordinator CpoB n=1 Tax=Allopseudospirillum japonicum TaxID=64971 RepID=A0A1H6QG35_9GAMM|nr:tol-pal system protein YbgF [Allopseudospirillum japonicum]SEI37932.1 tol-pal system protein YbgF [Allopseudospirillum japonicum]
MQIPQLNRRFSLLSAFLFVSVSSSYAQTPNYYYPPSVSTPESRAQANSNTQLLMQLEQLQSELQSLRDVVERQTYELNQLKRDQRERYLDVDQRLTHVGQEVSEARQQALQALDIAQTLSKIATRLGADTQISVPKIEETAPTGIPRLSSPSLEASQETAGELPSSARSAYESAYAKVNARQFDQAIEAFRAFIRDYPDSKLVANAYYWMGEIFMAQNRTQDAERMFDTVVKNYTRSYKVADSLYKLGLVYARYGQQDKAQLTMQELIDKYPKSAAAKLAENYLTNKS